MGEGDGQGVTVELAGRDGAFAAFVAARSGALLRTAYLVSGDRGEAEDLLQTALAKTYLAWSRVEDAESLEAYVRRVMVTTHISWWRRHRNRVRPSAAAGELIDVPGADAVVVERDSMWRALAGLSRQQRTVLVLRYYEDLSEAEIAAVMGCSTGSVKTHASRGLAALRVRLAADGAVEGTTAETAGGDR